MEFNVEDIINEIYLLRLFGDSNPYAEKVIFS